jgi:hypothetical protein
VVLRSPISCNFHLADKESISKQSTSLNITVLVFNIWVEVLIHNKIGPISVVLLIVVVVKIHVYEKECVK